MNERIEAIIPVLMPSDHLERIRQWLKVFNQGIRVCFILDYGKVSKHNRHNSRNLYVSSSRERFLLGNFGSPGTARNAGLRESRADFVCFWDVDDFPIIDGVSDLATKMSLEGADLGIGNWNFYEFPSSTTKGMDPESVAKNPGIWRWLFRRTSFMGLQFEGFNWGEDQLFLVNALERNPKIVTTNKVIYLYRSNSTNSLTTKHSYVKDLATVAIRISEIPQQRNRPAIIFSNTLLLRQSLTIFKYGGLSMGIRSLVKILLRSSSKLSLIGVIFRIIRADSW